MKLQLVVALSYISTLVSAGGYQGCLERVHLFQAYEIDGLMQSGDRILGFKCANWDEQAKECRNSEFIFASSLKSHLTEDTIDQYIECSGSRSGGRCNFDELMNHLNKQNEAQNWSAGVYKNNGRIDEEKTALKCYERYKNRGGVVPNFPAW